MAPPLTMPAKVLPGARVAVVSPSFAAPGAFPAVHERAMRRLREDLGLEPVEYPTTRRLGASPKDRAADLMAAFLDPDIEAVLATIGGDDQIAVLPHLDAALIAEHPKAFLGYSDNSNLLNFLWRLGIAAYHGGSTMVHLGGRRELHPVTLASLCAALFEDVEVELQPVEAFSEDELDWSDPALFEVDAPLLASAGWHVHQGDRVVSGPTWGGNLEILHSNLATGRWMGPVEDFAGCVLLLETSEELPSAAQVFRMLRDAGERGLLEQFPAVLVARAKAAFFGKPAGLAVRDGYRQDQQEAIASVFATYSPSAMLVFDVDFGHTDPQLVLPHGGRVTIDGPAGSITADYRAGPVGDRGA